MPDKKVILFSFIGLGLLTVLVTVIAVSLSKPDSNIAEKGYPLLPEASDFIEGFKFPSEQYAAREFFLQGPDIYREQKHKWTRDDIKEFWIDPRSIALEYLTVENRKFLEEMFEKIP
jgi:hypothetical protein